MSDEKQAAPVQQVVADSIVDYANSLSSAAVELADRVDNKLKPITRPDDVCDEEAPKPEQQYPPLFAALRIRFQDIESSIARINYCLDRAEI